MKNIAVVFAGGVGSRMYGDLPKQFLEINEKPIIIQTLELFEVNDKIDEIYIACIKDYISVLEDMIKNLTSRKLYAYFLAVKVAKILFISVFLRLRKIMIMQSF